jgi:hypothetical protein
MKVKKSFFDPLNSLVMNPLSIVVPKRITKFLLGKILQALVPLRNEKSLYLGILNAGSSFEALVLGWLSSDVLKVIFF